MATYRVHCIDGAGQITISEWVEAVDDREAVAVARILKKKWMACEVWNEERLVERLKAREE